MRKASADTVVFVDGKTTLYAYAFGRCRYCQYLYKGRVTTVGYCTLAPISDSLALNSFSDRGLATLTTTQMKDNLVRSLVGQNGGCPLSEKMLKFMEVFR